MTQSYITPELLNSSCFDLGWLTVKERLSPKSCNMASLACHAWHTPTIETECTSKCAMLEVSLDVPYLETLQIGVLLGATRSGVMLVVM